jgi:drug/metabolite transporter (DMT)-like permease
LSLKNWIKFCAVGLIWGSTFLWIKIAIQEVGPYTLVLYRIIFSILTLLFFAVRKWQRPDRSILIASIFLGLFNLIIPQVLISWGEQYLPSWLASILVSAVPFLTVLLSLPLIAEEKLNWIKGIGLLLGFSGVFVLVSGSLNEGRSVSLFGPLAILGAALCFAVSNVFTRIRAERIQPEVLTFWMMLSALAVIFPLAWGVEGPLVVPRLALTWVALVWMGVLNGGLAMIFSYSLIQSIGPGRSSLVAYTYPLVGVVLGIVFLGERPGWELALGGLLVIMGIIVFNRKNWRKNVGRESI